MNVWVINILRINLFLFFLTLLLSACNGSICSNEIRDEKASPDGKYIATFFERNCGATTPYVQVISLRSSSIKFNSENYNDWVFTIHGKSDIEMYWEGIYKLQISFTQTSDKPTQRLKWREITISYKSR